METRTIYCYVSVFFGGGSEKQTHFHCIIQASVSLGQLCIEHIRMRFVFLFPLFKTTLDDRLLSVCDVNNKYKAHCHGLIITRPRHV